MRNYLLLAVCLFCIGGLAAQQRNYERHWKSGVEKVRVISYNIFNGFDWKRDADRKERLAQWVRQQDPEVLALQELCGFTQQDLSELGRQWGHPYAVILKEKGYPVGITSKRPIEVKGKQTEQFGHGLLHVRTYGLDVLVTHLNPNNARQRNEEACRIVEYICEHVQAGCLLMGDMNSHSPMDADWMESHATELRIGYGGKDSPNLLNGKFDYSVISRFLSVPLIDFCRSFIAPERRFTFPTPVLMTQSRHPEVRRKVSERLDFIFGSSELESSVVDAFIWNGGETDYLSDHYPIGIDLCLPVGE